MGTQRECLTEAELPDLPLEAIRSLCQRRGVEELSIFGSAVRGELGPESDLDFLVRFRSGAEQPWQGHFLELEEELGTLLGRRVHLADRKAVEQSRNWIRRQSILESARLLYEA